MTNPDLLAGFAAARGFVPAAILRFGGAEFAVARNGEGEKRLLGAALARRMFPEGFVGEDEGSREGFLRIGELNDDNAAMLRRVFPWCAAHADGAVTRQGEPDELTFAMFAANDRSGYLLEYPLAFNTQLPPEGYSWFSFHPDHFTSGTVGAAPEYLNHCFVAGGNAVRFDAAMMEECTARYVNFFPKLVFWSRALRKSRKEDHRLILEAGELPPQHLLYLAREIRALEVPNVIFRVPTSRVAEVEAICSYGNFPVIV